MKRVALLGAGGFVGARFVEMAALCPDIVSGIELVPIIRQPRGLGRLSKLGVTNYRTADAGKVETLVRAIAKCDAVVNLTMGHSWSTLSEVQSIHQACRIAGVPLLVHISSAEVYGRCDQPGLQDDSPWQKSHWMDYARAKGHAEDWLRGMLTEAPIGVMLRPGLIWGPRSPWVTGPAQMIYDGNAFLVDHGKWACNLCHVDRVIHSILRVVRADSPCAGFYNIGDADRPSWRRYFEALASEIGQPDPFFHQVAESAFVESPFTRLSALKSSRFARMIKRRMRTQTKEGVKQWFTQTRRRLRPEAGEVIARPHVAKNLWWLQTTRYHLPIQKFDSAFGKVEAASFEADMRNVGRWLRFSGFGLGWKAGSEPSLLPANP